MTTFTIKEVADELRVSRQTISKWIRQGKLNAIRLGHRTVRITEEELERIKRDGL